MKRIIFKLTRVAITAVMIVATTTIANAQLNPGGFTGGTGTLDNAAQAAAVPFDANMNMLFVATALLFVAYKFKKGKLSLLA